MREVEGGVGDGGGKADQPVAVEQFLFPETVLFPTEDKGNLVLEGQGGDLGDGFPGGGGHFPEAANPVSGAHYQMGVGYGAGKVGKGFTGVEDLFRGVGHPSGLPGVPCSGVDQNEPGDAGIFENPGGSADVAGCGWFDQDDPDIV